MEKHSGKLLRNIFILSVRDKTRMWDNDNNGGGDSNSDSYISRVIAPGNSY